MKAFEGPIFKIKRHGSFSGLLVKEVYETW